MVAGLSRGRWVKEMYMLMDEFTFFNYAANALSYMNLAI